MIKEFYIIESSGIGVYEYHQNEVQEKVDLQLLTGLTTALVDFSQQTFTDNMQTLKLENDFMVVSRAQDKSNRLAVGIYDKNDHEVPAKYLNKKLLREFNQTYQFDEDKSIPKDFSNFTPANHFKRGFLPIAFPKGILPTIIITTFFTGFLYCLLRFLFVERFFNIMSFWFQNNLDYGFFMGVIAAPYLLMGILLGKRYLGLIAGTISISILEFALIIEDVLVKGNTFIFGNYDFLAAFVMLLCFAGGYIGELLFLTKAKRKEK